MNKLNIDGGAAVSVKITNDPVMREAPRWLFFAGDLPDTVSDSSPAGGSSFPSRCIVPWSGPPGFMNRCLVTPLIIVSVDMDKHEVPDGWAVLSGASGRDQMGRLTDNVKIPLYPGTDVEPLMRGYEHWGLKEIVCLRGQTPEQVVPLKINSIFFPNWPELPETNADLRAHVEARRQNFARQNAAKIYLQVADEMLEAINQTDIWMRNHISAVHSMMGMPHGHPEHKAVYDRVDMLFLRRTGMQRRDQDLMTMTQTQKDITELMSRDSGGALTPDALRAILAENAKLLQAALVSALATVQKPAGAEAETQ